MQHGVNASDLFLSEIKPPLIESVEQGVPLMSSSQLNTSLEEAGVDDAVQDELLSIYGMARTDAFKAGVALLVFAGLLGLVLTLGLPKRKLVGEETAVSDSSLAT